ncbi:hypothetical protein FRC08_005619 [Ceratobasidium sp. 394]|nr:hypothetical protein FRC08_005619 [Ceratobasidium sp. 394]
MDHPINLLPADILGRIFSVSTCFCSQRIHHETEPSILSPVLFSSICKRWRQIALDHPSLWTHIDLVVNVMDVNGRYHSPDVWVKHSKGAPIYVHVYQPRFATDDYELEEGAEYFNMSAVHRRSRATMVHRLGNFLLPLAPQLYSLTASIPWPYHSTLTMLTDLWAAHGSPGHAKVLKVRAHPERAELELCSSTSYQPLLASLEVLHLHNAVLPRSNYAFGNLIELRIVIGGGKWSLTLSELAAILASCPRLQHLTLARLLIETTTPTPEPVLLAELKTLELGRFSYRSGGDSPTMLELVLSILNPGQNALCMTIALGYLGGSQQPLDAVGSFIARSNVTSLSVSGPDVSMMPMYDPYFASQLGPLPRVQTLVLDKWHICDSFEVKLMSGRIKTYENPRPINPEVVLWPQLQSLYLRECNLEKDHLRQLVPPHSIQSLFMRDCCDGYKPQSPSDAGTSTSEEYVQLLSAVVPQVVYFPNGRDSWPPRIN